MAAAHSWMRAPCVDGDAIQILRAAQRMATQSPMTNTMTWPTRWRTPTSACSFALLLLQLLLLFCVVCPPSLVVSAQQIALVVESETIKSTFAFCAVTPPAIPSDDWSGEARSKVGLQDCFRNADRPQYGVPDFVWDAVYVGNGCVFNSTGYGQANTHLTRECVRTTHLVFHPCSLMDRDCSPPRRTRVVTVLPLLHSLAGTWSVETWLPTSATRTTKRGKRRWLHTRLASDGVVADRVCAIVRCSACCCVAAL